MKIKIGVILVFLIITNSCNNNQDYLELDGDWRVTHILYNNKDISGNKFSDSTKWSIPLYKTKLYYIDLASKQWVLYINGEDNEPIRGKFEISGNKIQDSINFKNSSDPRFNGHFHKKMEYDTIEDAFRNAYYFLTLKSEDLTIMAVKAKSLPIQNKK